MHQSTHYFQANLSESPTTGHRKGDYSSQRRRIEGAKMWNTANTHAGRTPSGSLVGDKGMVTRIVEEMRREGSVYHEKRGRQEYETEEVTAPVAS